jgi:hypothetical protein
MAQAKEYCLSSGVFRSTVDGNTSSSSANGPMVASIRAPRMTMPLSSSRTMCAISAPPACWLPETARLACGGISVCVQRRSSSRTFS